MNVADAHFTGQEQSENPLPLGQLRDAINASQFESSAAMHEWLDRAVGKNVKLLRIAMTIGDREVDHR